MKLLFLDNLKKNFEIMSSQFRKWKAKLNTTEKQNEKTPNELRT